MESDTYPAILSQDTISAWLPAPPPLSRLGAARPLWPGAQGMHARGMTTPRAPVPTWSGPALTLLLWLLAVTGIVGAVR